MSPSSPGRWLTRAAILLAGLAFAPPIRAAVVVTTASFDAGSRTGLAATSTSFLPIAITAGRTAIAGYDSATLSPLTYQTYAYELAATPAGGVYTLKTLASTGLSAIKQAQLNALIANTAAIATTADTSAAVQLALWEVINETAASGYSLSAGAFSVSGGNLATARGIANTYLANVNTDVWKSDSSYTLGLLSSTLSTDQITWTVAPQQAVPEPATWALFIGGFGMIGGAMRRRRAREAATA